MSDCNVLRRIAYRRTEVGSTRSLGSVCMMTRISFIQLEGPSSLDCVDAVAHVVVSTVSVQDTCDGENCLWEVGNWGACSTGRCQGPGTRARNVTCPSPRGESGCKADERLAAVEPCRMPGSSCPWLPVGAPCFRGARTLDPGASVYSARRSTRCSQCSMWIAFLCGSVLARAAAARSVQHAEGSIAGVAACVHLFGLVLRRLPPRLGHLVAILGGVTSI